MAERAEAPDVAAAARPSSTRASARRPARAAGRTPSAIAPRARRAAAPRATPGRGSIGADPQPALVRALCGAPQHGRDAQSQLGVGERLRHEVVGAALEAAHAIGLARAPAEHDQRQPRVEPRAGPAAVAQRAQQLEPRAVGQAEIEQDEVDRVVLERAQRVAQRAGHEQLVAVGGQVVGQEGPRRELVLDDQDGGGLGHARQEGREAAFSPPVAARASTMLPRWRGRSAAPRSASAAMRTLLRPRDPPRELRRRRLPRALPVRRPAQRTALHGLPAQGLRDRDRRRAVPRRPSARGAASAPSSSRARRCGAATSRSSARSPGASPRPAAATAASSTGRTTGRDAVRAFDLRDRLA